MSSEATVQVLDTSIDRTGLSIVTTTKTADNPRLGAIYTPLTLAAARPVWFHPLQTGSFLTLLQEHWTAATIGSGGPGTYSAKTVSTIPTWVTVNPVTGAVTNKGEMPSRLSGTRILRTAISRIDALYTVGTIEGIPWIVHYRVDPGGQLILQAEEILPVVEGVSFGAGIYIDGAKLILIGTDGDGKVYRMRKPWGSVGNTIADTWQYKGVKGWLTDVDNLEPEVGLTSDGPVTYAKNKDREYLVTRSGGNVHHFWSSRMVDTTWTTARANVTVENLYLQPQLDHNPLALADGVNAAVPWVSTHPVTTGGANALQVAWGVLPV